MAWSPLQYSKVEAYVFLVKVSVVVLAYLYMGHLSNQNERRENEIVELKQEVRKLEEDLNYLKYRLSIY